MFAHLFCITNLFLSLFHTCTHKCPCHFSLAHPFKKQSRKEDIMLFRYFSIFSLISTKLMERVVSTSSSLFSYLSCFILAFIHQINPYQGHQQPVSGHSYWPNFHSHPILSVGSSWLCSPHYFFFFLNIPSLKHSSLASVTAFSRLSLSQGKLCLFSIPGGSFSTRPAGGPWAPITAVSSSCTLSQFQGVTGR